MAMFIATLYFFCPHFDQIKFLVAFFFFLRDTRTGNIAFLKHTFYVV